MATNYDPPGKVCVCPDCHDYTRSLLCEPCLKMGCDGRMECRVREAHSHRQKVVEHRVALVDCYRVTRELVEVLREIQKTSNEDHTIRKARAAADSVEGARR